MDDGRRSHTGLVGSELALWARCIASPDSGELLFATGTNSRPPLQSVHKQNDAKYPKQNVLSGVIRNSDDATKCLARFTRTRSCTFSGPSSRLACHILHKAVSLVFFPKKGFLGWNRCCRESRVTNYCEATWSRTWYSTSCYTLSKESFFSSEGDWSMAIASSTHACGCLVERA